MSTSVDMLERHHATLSLLQAMYPMEGELVLPPRTYDFLSDPSSYTGEVIEFELNVALPDSVDAPLAYSISLPVPIASSSSPDAAQCSVYLRQPASLTRAEHEQLLDQILPQDTSVPDDEYILEIISAMPSAIDDIIAARPAENTNGQVKVEALDDGPLERVWFWFPTLSSKEKRRDIVEYAAEAGLTGFVLAGKPALLCVEGGGHAVNRYMARIKSESWSDIPPGHKKVTERLRLSLSDAPPPKPNKRENGSNPSGPSAQTDRILYRQLPPLVDISDEISRYGTYAHRAEMSEVRKIVDRWGVGEEMGQVLMM